MEYFMSLEMVILYLNSKALLKEISQMENTTHLLNWMGMFQDI